ncbi:phospholipase B1, membrane-associated-like [Montipora capricornis]|uniref:phospholipase B1, membrane-associated-like n=1 Tax=Montipora capricornis TaxID=246305 RepID=UPI0035F1C247
MASVLFAWKLTVFSVFCAYRGFASGSLLFMNATSVEVGYLWESPRLQNLDTADVVVDKEHLGSTLRLICSISPPLSADEDHWDLKDELVNWYKTGPKTETVKKPRYWSNNMKKTAISFFKVTLDVLGSYSCSYGGLTSSIDVLVANAEVVKALKKPENFMELKTYVSYMKDKSGLNGWKDKQELLLPFASDKYCSPLPQKSQHAPHSVHQLRPSDIKVIAAMGDTFNLALGARATSLNGFFTDYQDISWSIGGGSYLNYTTTLPNIIAQFNPGIRGASLKNSTRDDLIDPDLNFAFVGASASDLREQAVDLVSKLKAMKGINFQNDWKLLTVWIGTDNLCQVCKDEDKFSPSSFIKYVMRMLSYLQKEVPRLFVNLVPPMDVSSLHRLYEESSQSCEILGWNSCPCLKEGAAERSKISQMAKEYKRLLNELVNSGLYDTHDTFAVVIQPALEAPPRTQDGNLVKSFIGLDCLHFSAHGHAAAALALWRNMLEPVGSKTKAWGDQETLKCPSEDKPYLFTRRNSEMVLSDTNGRNDVDDGSSKGFPPGAAVALAVCLTAIVIIVVVFVWRSRISRRRPEASRLLYAPGPQKPRI